MRVNGLFFMEPFESAIIMRLYFKGWGVVRQLNSVTCRLDIKVTNDSNGSELVSPMGSSRPGADLHECLFQHGSRVAAGDPVVVTANRYQDALFNGLLGVVTAIDGPLIKVLWDGEREDRDLTSEAQGDIELAYGITCHKAQGSSSPAVIVVVENSGLVTREWLYTALTRARELVLLIGDDDAVAKAVARRTIRTTGFSLPARRLQ